MFLTGLSAKSLLLVYLRQYMEYGCLSLFSITALTQMNMQNRQHGQIWLHPSAAKKPVMEREGKLFNKKRGIDLPLKHGHLLFVKREHLTCFFYPAHIIKQ